MGGNIPGEKFLGEGGDFLGVSLMGRDFSGGNSPGGNFPRTIFFI